MTSKYDVAGLIEALGHQKQCDDEGVMCEVSRQAVDEAAALLKQYHDALVDIKDLDHTNHWLAASQIARKALEE